MKILFVDDDEAIRDIVPMLFEYSEHDLVVAANGEQALMAFKEQSFDLVLTDINMPVMSGHDLLSEVRSKYPGLRVVAMTGDDMSDNTDFDGVVTKPVSDFFGVVEDFNTTVT